MTTIEFQMHRNALGRFALAAVGLVLGLGLFSAPVARCEEAPAGVAEGAGGEGHGVDWQAWRAHNQITDTSSLQRGASNFVNYCLGCHSLKYMRFERMAKDLHISDEQLRKNLIPTGAKPTDYMISSFPKADAEAWFGRQPPDLSLITRSKGTDYVFQFLKGFYVDESRPTRSNNLALPGAAMPAVLSDLEGVKRAVFGTGESSEHGGKLVERFEQVSPGALTPAQYDAFVRDTANFLQYVGEPSQVERESIGIWVVLFLLVFTWFAWLLKREYWKDVH
jgi:ubiquinol-cytochrome c reductase cytochrome c1 subunit